MRVWWTAVLLLLILVPASEASCHRNDFCGRMTKDIMDARAPTSFESQELLVRAMAHWGDKDRVPDAGVPTVAPGGFLVLQVDLEDRSGAGRTYSVRGDTLGQRDHLVSAWQGEVSGTTGGRVQALLWFEVSDLIVEALKLADGTSLPNIHTVAFVIEVQDSDGLPRTLRAQVPVELVSVGIGGEPPGGEPDLPEDPTGTGVAGGVYAVIGVVALSILAIATVRFK